jgi:hypothetical protein
MTATAAAGFGRPLVLRNVTVVDTRDGALTPSVDVLVSDGVIAAITTATRMRRPRRP